MYFKDEMYLVATVCVCVCAISLFSNNLMFGVS